jgi:Ca-activated chloride channel family protein
MGVSDVFPRETPDLFPGRPVILTGRFTGTGSTTVHVTGNAGNTPLQFGVPANLSETTTTTKGLPIIWARMKISDLADQSIYAPNPQLPYEIKQVALDYALVSPFTAFLAVDASDLTEGPASMTVPVAVPAPAGVNHDKTVPEN